MSQNQSANLRVIVYTALFTALIIIGGYLGFPIPFSPLPVVLSDFFVMLAGLFLGSSAGVSSVGLFIFLGALGLPVFAGGKAGLAVLVGPTAGFLCGYMACAFVIGLISTKGKPSMVKDFVALIAGNILIYGLGVPGLKLVLGLTWGNALAAGFLSFIPGTIIKVIVALALAKVLRSKFRQTMYPQLPTNLEG
ncbi:MAG TPA: biotin transporter BioY [Candidatus Brocadiaceae bacterium]